MDALTIDGVGRLEDSTGLLDDPPALREKAARDGYLFLRSFLPREEVRRVRRQILEVLSDRSWLKADAPIEAGVIDQKALALLPESELRVDIGISREGYAAVQKVHGLHRLPHHPRLLRLYETLFREPVFVHPRHIVRVSTSHPALRPTPPHQDFPLVQGSENTWTCWAPLGDAAMDVGPLAVLRGSNTKGVIPLGRLGTGGFDVGLELCDDETDWLSENFAAGDVLTFPALTIHRAIAARRKDIVRLSMDVRYQPASDPIEEKSLSNHADVPWSEIYRDWVEHDVQYYWEADSPRLSPWDETILQNAPVERRIC